MRYSQRQTVRPALALADEPDLFQALGTSTSVDSRFPTSTFPAGAIITAFATSFPGPPGGYVGAAYEIWGYCHFRNSASAPTSLALAIANGILSISLDQNTGAPITAASTTTIALMDTDWDPATITWNTRPTFSGKIWTHDVSADLPASGTGIQLSTELQWKIFDAPNPCYGFAIKVAAAAPNHICEMFTALRPYVPIAT